MSGINRRQLLAGGAAGLAAGALPIRARSQSARPTRLVIVRAGGGWDPTFCFEPRFSDGVVTGPDIDATGAPGDEEEIRSIHGVDLMCNDYKRPSVTAFFEKWMPRTAIINGIWTGSIAHEPASIRMFTGTADTRNPDFGAIVGATYGNALPLGYIDISGYAFTGPLAASSGQLGYKAQIRNLVDAVPTYEAPGLLAAEGVTYPMYLSPDPQAIRDFTLARAERYRALPGRGLGANALHLDNLGASLERAARFRGEAAEILSQLEIGKNPSLTDSTTLAADLLNANLCTAVLLDGRQAFDTHSNNADQHEHYEDLFFGLSNLMDGLEAYDLVDSTMVAVISEMTRTPGMNEEGGKDHWAHATIFVTGGGVAGARKYGGYNELVESRPIDYATGDPIDSDDPTKLLKYDNLVAGLIEAMGIDSEQWLKGVTPFTAFHG
jgi:hypothetical protein